MGLFFTVRAAPRVLLFPVALSVLLGCSGPALGLREPKSAATPEAGSHSLGPNAELDLNEDELLIASALRDHTRAFRSHGKRDGDHPWELLESVEYVSATLEGQGLPLQRATTEKDGVIFHSFTVSVPGEDPAAPSWIVVASYDSLWPRLASLPNSPSAEIEPGALEAASWLELVRQLGHANLRRGVRFVLLARPNGGGEEALQELVGQTKSVGVFYLCGRLGSRELVLSAGGADAGLASALADELESVPGTPLLRRESLAAPFPALSFLAADATQAINFSQVIVAGRRPDEDLALAAVRLNAMRRALGAFLGERPTNDETVTPLYTGLR